MKIIGRTTCRYCRLEGAVVELTMKELAIVLNGNESQSLDHVTSGQVLNLHERFTHSQRILERAEAAKKLPGVLRSLADALEVAVLEIAVPKIEAIIYDEDEQSA